MLNTVLSFAVNLASSFFRSWLGERSRDKAHEDLTVKKAENELLTEKLERAKNAKKVSDNINDLTDDELDEQLRNSRELSKSKSEDNTE